MNREFYYCKICGIIKLYNPFIHSSSASFSQYTSHKKHANFFSRLQNILPQFPTLFYVSMSISVSDSRFFMFVIHFCAPATKEICNTNNILICRSNINAINNQTIIVSMLLSMITIFSCIYFYSKLNQTKVDFSFTIYLPSFIITLDDNDLYLKNFVF